MPLGTAQAEEAETNPQAVIALPDITSVPISVIPAPVVTEEEALARVTPDEALAQGHLALAAQVDVRRVEVVETSREEAVEHLVAELVVGICAPHGKAHRPKAEAPLELAGR